MHAPSVTRRIDNPNDRLRLTLEIGAVIALGALPHLLRALSIWIYPDARSAVSSERPLGYAYQGLVSSFQILLPLLYILWRSGVPWQSFGIVRIDLRLDALLTLAYVMFGWIAYYTFGIIVGVAAYVLPFIGELLTVVPEPAAEIQSMNTRINADPTWLFVVWMIVNGLTEELVTKAYLIPRLRALSGSVWFAVLASSAVFASYHIYQGSHRMLLIFLPQIVLGWVFVKVRRIWPFALGHALFDVSILLAQTV